MKNKIGIMSYNAYVLPTVIALAGVMALAGSTSAQGLDSLGFENPPYTSGISVSGQEEWFTDGFVSTASGIVTVGPDNLESPLAGAQSLYMKNTGTSGFARHRVGGTTFLDNTSLKWLQQITGGDWSTVTVNNGVGGGLTFAEVEFNSGGAIFSKTSAGSTNIGSYTLGDVYEVEMVFDYTNNQYEVILDNITAGGGPTSAGSHNFITPTTGAQAGVGSGAQVLLRGRSGTLFDNVVLNALTSPVADIDVGFESPDFTTVGSADYQGEWFLTGASTFGDIVTAGPIGAEPALSGSQSLYMQGSGFLRHSLLGQTAADGTSLKWKEQITDGDWSTVTLNADVLGSGVTYAQVEFNSDGDIFALTDTGNFDIGDYIAGDIYEVEMVVNYTTDQYEVFLNNLTAGGGAVSAGLHNFVVAVDAADAVDGPDAEILLRMRSGGLFDDVQFIGGIPGDFNLDGTVNGADFLILQRGLGTIYNATDLADWEANYGAPLSATSTAVPEPTTGIILMLGMVAILLRRHAVVS